MIRILFVCTGNICRSPMAEAIFRDLVKAEGVEDQFEIDSAGLISYHRGESADERALDTLQSHGISHDGSARQVKKSDFYEYDYILCMTADHLEQLETMKPEDSDAQISLLMSVVDNPENEEVPDPYYSGNFEETYDQVSKACRQLFTTLEQNGFTEN